MKNGKTQVVGFKCEAALKAEIQRAADAETDGNVSRFVRGAVLARLANRLLSQAA